MAIDTIESLRQHLKWAMRVELTLVPVYLYAAYSIKDANADASRLIISVAAEEMLHGALDANMLIAIGGEPKFYDPGFTPDYPMAMPHHKPPIMLQLQRATPAGMELFCVIEKPEAPNAPPEDDDYETQGQFYSAIEQAFEGFSEAELFADPRPERQLGEKSYYAPVQFDSEDSGGLELITDMASVRRAMHTVIHQGEGLTDEKWADPAHKELTHYYKFLAIREGEKPIGEVWPTTDNPKSADMHEPLASVAEFFSAVYCYLLILMDRLYQPCDPSVKNALVGRLYTVMKDALGPTARFLMSQPLRPGGSVNAGPPFEFYEFASPDTAQEELGVMAAHVVEAYPELRPVAAAVAPM